MTLFENWCACELTENGRKRLLKFTERDGGRAVVKQRLPGVVRSHYDEMHRIAEDIAKLGYQKAAVLLNERMPRSVRARSGELGEILATEMVEERLGYQVPVRRLRYKDGREMALRGDDFIGLTVKDDGGLLFAKGESKSRASLSQATIIEARSVLSRDAGRPTPTSLLFVADRLMDRGGADEATGRAVRDQMANQAIPGSRVEHVLFTISANATPTALVDDLAAAPNIHPHTVIHVRIEDHQDFIKSSYEEALNLGDD